MPISAKILLIPVCFMVLPAPDLLAQSMANIGTAGQSLTIEKESTLNSAGLRFGAVLFRGDVQDATALRGTEVPLRWGFDVFYSSPLFMETGNSISIAFAVEATAGCRILKAHHDDYSFNTIAVPISGSLSAEIIIHRFFRPFLSVGGGTISYHLTVEHSDRSVASLGTLTGSGNGLCFWFPLRVGIKHAIGESIDLIVMAERSVTLSDRLDGIISKGLDWQNDNFEMLSIGFSLRLGHISQAPHFVNSEVESGRKSLFIDFDAKPPFAFAADLKIDGDSKGLPDYDDAFTHDTSLHIADCEEDGLPDGLEIEIGTDLRASDANDDGIADAAVTSTSAPETFSGVPYAGVSADPGEADAAFKPEQKSVALAGISFYNNSPELMPQSFPVLDSLAEALRSAGGYVCTVICHADSAVDGGKGMILSWERALAVKKHLMLRGVGASRLRIDGRSLLPASRADKHPEGRAAGGRVIELNFMAAEH